MISRQSIDQLIETAQVEEVVQQFVNLKRRGVNMIGLCPFHDEKTPSFTVSPSKNIYKCFGCGKGGNAINFIMEHEGYSFPEAIRYLAKMYNIELEESTPSPEEEQKSFKRDSLFIVTEFAKNRFIHNLFHTQSGVNIGLSYFKERGFREGTIKEFGLGFAPDAYSDLTNVAQEKKYKSEFLIEVGLSTSKGRDFFRNRVIFPVHNLSGKAIAFGGRTLTNDKKIPKYINSPESEIYNKRKSLYALYFAKNAIRKEDNCILVEGYTDVISLHQAGIKQVVSSSGTSLTTDQIKLIRRYTQNITVIYDGDAAGINAAMRGMELILAENMYVRIVSLPEAHDPDSYLRSVGPTAFIDFLNENAKDFILFKTTFLGNEAKNDPVRKVTVLKEIVKTLSNVPDPLARSTYIKECSSILDIDERILVSETNKLIKKEIRQRRFREEMQLTPKTQMEVLPDAQKSAPAPTQFIQGETDEYHEKELMRIILTHGHQWFDEKKEQSILDYIIEQCIELIPYFENQFYTQLFIDVVARRKENKNIGPNYFLHHENTQIQQFAIDLLSNPYSYADWSGKGMELQTQKTPDENYIREATQSCIRLNYRKLDSIIEENLQKLKQLDASDEEYIVTLTIHNKLLEERKLFAQQLNNVIS